ncbi:MAG: hypothetical protein ACK55I_37340, partial [bacterium]
MQLVFIFLFFTSCQGNVILLNANNNDCGPSEEDPTTTNTTPTPPATATSVIIVRYFGTRHLGVTCGRLTG